SLTDMTTFHARRSSDLGEDGGGSGGGARREQAAANPVSAWFPNFGDRIRDVGMKKSAKKGMKNVVKNSGDKASKQGLEQARVASKAVAKPGRTGPAAARKLREKADRIGE